MLLNRYRIVSLCIVLANLVATAQVPAPLSNADLVKMIQGGIPESVIVNKIRTNAGHLDTSVDALIALRKAGATEAELTAMTTPPVFVGDNLRVVGVPIPSQPVDAMGGQLLRTTQGDPYLVFQATQPGYFPDGRPNNSAFLVLYEGSPAVLIPSTIVFGDNCVVGNLLVTESGTLFDAYVTGCGEFSNEAGVVGGPPHNFQNDDFITARSVKTKWYGEALRLQSKSMKGDIIIGVYPLVKKAPLIGENHTNTSALRSGSMTLFFTDLVRDFPKTIEQIETAADITHPLQQLSNAAIYKLLPFELKTRYKVILTQRLSERASGGSSWLALARGVQATQQMTSGLLNTSVGASTGNASQFGSGLQAMAAASGSQVISNDIVGTGTQSTSTSQNPATIENATNQQLANIRAAQAHAQQTQTVETKANKQTASVESPFRYSPAHPTPQPVANTGTAPPPSCVYLGPGNCVPIEQYKQQQTEAGVVVDTLCPATGFVPGVMIQTGDIAVGVPCRPGSVIYVNGVPQFSTAGTTYNNGHGNTITNSTGASGTGTPGAGNGNAGQGGTSTSYGETENACVQLSNDAQNRPTFHNTCTTTLHVYWTPLYPAPGDYLAFNVYLAPGQSEVGTNIGEYRVYACQQGYLVVGPDGKVITQAVSGFRCVKQ